jgi:hypothetical protein
MLTAELHDAFRIGAHARREGKVIDLAVIEARADARLQFRVATEDVDAVVDGDQEIAASQRTSPASGLAA